MRTILALAASLLAAPAWAGCYDYTDPSSTTPAPRAVLCFAGECEETSLEVECGNVHGSGLAYANGWSFRYGENAANGDFEVQMSDGSIRDNAEMIECRPMDDGACPAGLLN